jgi:hypothetical protein
MWDQHKVGLAAEDGPKYVVPQLCGKEKRQIYIGIILL